MTDDDLEMNTLKTLNYSSLISCRIDSKINLILDLDLNVARTTTSRIFVCHKSPRGTHPTVYLSDSRVLISFLSLRLCAPAAGPFLPTSKNIVSKHPMMLKLLLFQHCFAD